MTVISANQILEVIDVQTYLSKRGINRYFYWTSQDPSGFTNWADVADQFDTHVVDNLTPLQSDNCEHIQIEVRPRGGTSIEHIESLTAHVGDLTGDNVASVSAWTMALHRTTNVTRSGQKRLWGYTEDIVTGDFIDSSQATLITALATGMLQPLASGGFSWQPVIARHNPLVDPHDWTINVVASCTSDRLITTQKSRQRTA